MTASKKRPNNSLSKNKKNKKPVKKIAAHKTKTVHKKKKVVPKKKPSVKALRHTTFLSLLGSTKERNRRNLLIEYAGKDDLDAICQCIFNLLSGNIKVSEYFTLYS